MSAINYLISYQASIKYSFVSNKLITRLENKAVVKLISNTPETNIRLVKTKFSKQSQDTLSDIQQKHKLITKQGTKAWFIKT